MYYKTFGVYQFKIDLFEDTEQPRNLTYAIQKDGMWTTNLSMNGITFYPNNRTLVSRFPTDLYTWALKLVAMDNIGQKAEYELELEIRLKHPNEVASSIITMSILIGIIFFILATYAFIDISRTIKALDAQVPLNTDTLKPNTRLKGLPPL